MEEHFRIIPDMKMNCVKDRTTLRWKAGSSSHILGINGVCCSLLLMSCRRLERGSSTEMSFSSLDDACWDQGPIALEIIEYNVHWKWEFVSRKSLSAAESGSSLRGLDKGSPLPRWKWCCQLIDSDIRSRPTKFLTAKGYLGACR
ncbi:hypothetical protein TNCV_542321 [Trichonephila clavipes]|nr:hypothetical protein TNCV_542321 [Trichonephila clavipes]